MLDVGVRGVSKIQTERQNDIVTRSHLAHSNLTPLTPLRPAPGGVPERRSPGRAGGGGARTGPGGCSRTHRRLAQCLPLGEDLAPPTHWSLCCWADKLHLTSTHSTSRHRPPPLQSHHPPPPPPPPPPLSRTGASHCSSFTS